MDNLEVIEAFDEYMNVVRVSIITMPEFDARVRAAILSALEDAELFHILVENEWVIQWVQDIRNGIKTYCVLLRCGSTVSNFYGTPQEAIRAALTKTSTIKE